MSGAEAVCFDGRSLLMIVLPSRRFDRMRRDGFPDVRLSFVSAELYKSCVVGQFLFRRRRRRSNVDL